MTFFESAILNFFLLHSHETMSQFIGYQGWVEILMITLVSSQKSLPPNISAGSVITKFIMLIPRIVSFVVNLTSFVTWKKVEKIEIKKGYDSMGFESTVVYLTVNCSGDLCIYCGIRGSTSSLILIFNSCFMQKLPIFSALLYRVTDATIYRIVYFFILFCRKT